MTKFVFVTGGVVSSLGKGIASASLAAILESRGLKVTLQARSVPQRRSGNDVAVPARRGVRHRRRRRDRPRPRPLRALHHDADEAHQQLHDRPDLQERAREGAPRRLPRQDGAGDPARHQRDPGVRQARRRRRARRRDRRDRRHGRRHRVAALPRSGAPDEPEDGPGQLRLPAPHARAVDRRGRRAEDQADPAQRPEAARDRHHARRPALPRRPADPRRGARQDLAVRQRARVRRDLGLGRRHDLQGAAHAARAGARRADLRQAAAAHQAGQPGALGQAGRRGRASAARGDDRDVRQVRRPVGLVQVAQRGAAPRRHPQPCAGQDRVRRFGRPDADERRQPGPLRRDPGSRAASASAASKARSSPVRAREEDSLPRHLPRHAGRDDRVRAPQGRAAPTAPSSIRRPSTR